MPPGDSLLLPDPPPPRPDRREEAIKAALRRFDSGEAASVAPTQVRPKPTGGWWSRSRQPQFAMAMSLALIVVIGVPATWIALRNGATSNAPTQYQAPAPASRYAPPETGSVTAETPQASAATSAEAAKELAEPPRESLTPPVAANDVRDEAPAAPVTALAAAPPPPPPPPAPPPAAPMLAQKSAEGANVNEVVVTGSLLRSPMTSREANNGAQSTGDLASKDRSYAAFMTSLQAAVRANDRGAVIKMIQFPLRVNSNGTSILYRDARSVRRDYERIFTSQVRQAILDQRVDTLFSRDQGAMVGNGQVWFDHTCSNAQCFPLGPVRIKAVNP